MLQEHENFWNSNVQTWEYYPPVVTTWKILTTGASYSTTGILCTVNYHLCWICLAYLWKAVWVPPNRQHFFYENGWCRRTMTYKCDEWKCYMWYVVKIVDAGGGKKLREPCDRRSRRCHIPHCCRSHCCHTQLEAWQQWYVNIIELKIMQNWK